MQNQLFRKKAMEKMASPEQLDTPLEVTSARGWLVLLTLALMLCAIVVWLFVGRLAGKVSGQGILIGGAAGTLTVIQSKGEGEIVELNVTEGDVVAAGDVVAVVDQPNLEDRVADAESDVQRARRELDSVRLETQAANARTRAEIKAAEAALQRTRDAIAEREARLAELQDLLEKGRIAQTRVDQVRTEVRNLRMQEDGHNSQLSSLRDVAAIRDRQVRAARSQLTEAQEQLDMARGAEGRYSRLTSPIAGRVVEVRAVLYSAVSRGEVIARIEPVGDKGEMPLVVPRFWIAAASAGRVEPGLEVEISPAGVERAEYGYIRGHVASVSQFPVSAERAEELGLGQGVARDLGSGSLTEVTAEITLNGEASSGFEWSSGTGPPWRIESGATIQVQVLVDQKPPIEVLIPKIRKFLGMSG